MAAGDILCKVQDVKSQGSANGKRESVHITEITSSYLSASALYLALYYTILTFNG